MRVWSPECKHQNNRNNDSCGSGTFLFSSVAATKGRRFRSMKYLTTMRMVWSAETCITPCSSEGSCRLAGQGHKGHHRIPEGLCLAFWLVLGFFLKKVFLGFLCLMRSKFLIKLVV